MSLHLSDADCDAILRGNADLEAACAVADGGAGFRAGLASMLDALPAVDPQAGQLRDAICYVAFYEEVEVRARTEYEAREKALTKCGIEGDMRRKVQVTFVRWTDSAVRA